MFRIAHISDIHLAPLPLLQMQEILNKRVLGYLSWQRQRRYRHRSAVLGKLKHDMSTQRPDHICITGDLTNIALPKEFEAATAWLNNLAPSEQISLIPGNHDAYVRAGVDLIQEHWQIWMGDEFPYLHRRGPLALIGLSTALPTLPFLASGSLGREQLVKLDTILESTGAAGLQRVVMLHHPPQAGAANWRKSLHDAAEFRSVIARRGAELILHGHTHCATRSQIEGPNGTVAVYGAGSASLYSEQIGAGAHYHLFDFGADGLRVHHRYYDANEDKFVAPDAGELERVK